MIYLYASKYMIEFIRQEIHDRVYMPGKI